MSRLSIFNDIHIPLTALKSPTILKSGYVHAEEICDTNKYRDVSEIIDLISNFKLGLEVFINNWVEGNNRLTVDEINQVGGSINHTANLIYLTIMRYTANMIPVDTPMRHGADKAVESITRNIVQFMRTLNAFNPQMCAGIDSFPRHPCTKEMLKAIKGNMEDKTMPSISFPVIEVEMGDGSTREEIIAELMRYTTPQIDNVYLTKIINTADILDGLMNELSENPERIGAMVPKFIVTLTSIYDNMDLLNLLRMEEAIQSDFVNANANTTYPKWRDEYINNLLDSQVYTAAAMA